MLGRPIFLVGDVNGMPSSSAVAVGAIPAGRTGMAMTRA